MVIQLDIKTKNPRGLSFKLNKSIQKKKKGKVVIQLKSGNSFIIKFQVRHS